MLPQAPTARHLGSVVRQTLRTASLAALLVAALGALGSLLPTRADAFSKAIWGPVTRRGVNQFPLYHKLGVTIYEASLNWNEIAPAEPAQPTNPDDPAYKWPKGIQQAIADGTHFRMRVLLQLINAPRWADGGHSGSGWAPRDPSEFAEFAEAAAKRYPSVHLWMIWGEPTRAGNFKPMVAARPGQRLDASQRAAPHLYARMLDDTYVTLKRVSARNKVIGGCTYTTGLLDAQQWIENLRLPDGRPPRMDMYADNPFSYSTPDFSAAPSPDGEVQFSDLPRLAGWINSFLGKPLPLFLSEFTIPTQPDDEFNFWVDPSVAATWITDALRLSRGWKRIDALGWINVYDDLPQTAGGLLTEGGRPKPGFYAFEYG